LPTATIRIVGSVYLTPEYEPVAGQFDAFVEDDMDLLLLSPGGRALMKVVEH